MSTATNPVADKPTIAPSAALDDRTEKLLRTLCPRAQEQARAHLAACQAHGIDARIISGTRSADEQNALYAQGRTKPGRIVTNAPAWESNHNFALAWDIGIFDAHGKYLEDSPLYAKAGAVGVALGLEWGGAWVSIQDEPHFQCRTGYTVKQLHALVKAAGFDLQKALPAIDALIKPLKTQALPDVPKPWSVTINGKSIGGVFRDGAGITFVPVRLFVEALKGKPRADGIQVLGGILYDGTRSGTHIAREADGDEIPVKILDSVAYAPVRSLCEAFGGTIAPFGVGDMARVVVVTG